MLFHFQHSLHKIFGYLLAFIQQRLFHYIQKLIERRAKLVNSIYSLSLSAVKSEKEVKNEDESKVVTLKASTTARRREGKQNKKYLIVNTINFFFAFTVHLHTKYELVKDTRNKKRKEKIKACGLENSGFFG